MALSSIDLSLSLLKLLFLVKCKSNSNQGGYNFQETKGGRNGDLAFLQRSPPSSYGSTLLALPLPTNHSLLKVVGRTFLRVFRCHPLSSFLLPSNMPSRDFKKERLKMP